ncbi:hypothetical protein AB5I41_21745 [Sphingomonas sp. MMS24-JH45]
MAERLPAGMDAAWAAVRPNLATVAEAADWWSVIHGEALGGEDPEFLAIAATVARDIDWTTDPWHALTDRLKAETGRKGKARLFLPLRRALTGRDHGPDMAALLPLIGRERAIGRLATPPDSNAAT